MNKLFQLLLILVVLLNFVLPQMIQARGTGAGTIITNAQDVDGDNTANQPGEVIGSYTNIGGFTNYAKATNITASTVSAGYDLSIINQPANASGGPGTFVTYDYYFTNRGNISAQMVVRISSNASDSQWGVSSYELWTNYGAGWGQVFPAANWISNTLPSVGADAVFSLRVRVNIPGSASDGSTNQFLFEIWDPAWTGAAGDQWPVSDSVLFGVPSDIADARDYQTDYVTTTVSGPVIQLSKSVDYVNRRPYEILTYTIRYTNAGSGDALNVIIDDVLYTNYVQILADSAETNNTVTHNPTNYYYDGTTWQPATWDTGNESLVERIRWQLRGTVASGEFGDLEFKVIIR